MGTGQIKPGGNASAVEHFFVRASPDGYILAFLSYCFNGCQKDVDDYTSDEVVALRSANTSKEHQAAVTSTPNR